MLQGVSQGAGGQGAGRSPCGTSSLPFLEGPIPALVGFLISGPCLHPINVLAVDPRVSITITRQGSAPVTVETSLPVEFGRLDPDRSVADVLLQPVPDDSGMRIAVADVMEFDVSRRQAVLADGSPPSLTNLSQTIPIGGPDGRPLQPGATQAAPLPCSFRVGRAAIDVRAGGLRTATPGTSAFSIAPKVSLTGTWPAEGTPEVREFVRWWQRVISLLQSASSSTDFFHKAADALVELVGLDMGAVFLRAADDWQPAAVTTRGETRVRPSSDVLRRVLADKQMVWNRGDAPVDIRSSIAQLEAYVAAPILDGAGDLLGVLYGHRMIDHRQGSEISEMESLLVEALACGVAAGLARMEHEAQAIKQKVTFGQFFSPELAARLEAEPDLLRGRDAEITVLFCDIRGFSSVSERLAPSQTMEWIGDVLSVLSDRVAETGGVLVDYVGDELMAMWGAPTAQPNHATLACTAARTMFDSLPDIDSRWASVIGVPTRVSIGANSTTARVGNTGSTRKFKYGPLGNGVNIASRVRGATKYLRVDAIITGSTRRLLAPTHRVRRLCKVQVVNIAEPLDLFELDCGQYERTDELFPAFEEALAAFEQADFSRAARLLGGLLDAHPGDGPSLVLLSRAVDAMVNEPETFSPIWRLKEK
jgi:adenylate cyclase